MLRTMMQALSNHFSTRFMLCVLFLWVNFGVITPGYAALIGPNPPSLSATKSATTVDLRWTMDCSITSANIQESTNGTVWTTVYTGLGNPNDNSMIMSFASLFVGPTMCSGWTSSRYLNLTNKTQSGYYYRINACQSSSCGAYGSAVLVGSIGQTPAAPATISSPASNSSGSFTVSWAASSGAQRYELQQRINSGSWVAKYSGTATSYAVSGLASGSYQFQVRACASACSAWKLSSNTQVTLAQPGTDWKNFTKVTVPNANGSDSAPSESVDLSAASLKGQGSVSGGQASYQIPIDLPPGRNGVQPSVSLSYNSQGGNGLLGVGWSLNAGSAISRCGATFAQDGFTRAVTFNATTDRLCLDGQRLVAISGTYGASNAEYRTEMDSFVKVVQSGGINDSNSYFTVHKADGNRATYGFDADSRFSPSGLSTVLSWKVTQEVYSNGANTIDYQYDTSVAGEHLLSKIYYTGSTAATGDRLVQFSYQARVDKRQSYMAGGKLVTSKRLSKVETYVHTTQAVNTYKLSYTASKASKRSLLEKVQQCGVDNGVAQCSPLTQFNWSDSQYFAPPTPLTFSGVEIYKGVKEIEKITPFGDADGNGTADFPGYMVDAEQNQIGTNALSVNSHCRYVAESLRYDCLQADFDMDGKIDPFRFSNGYIEVQYSTKGDSYIKTAVPIALGSTMHPGDRVSTIQDINGDGWPDLVMYRFNGGYARLEVYPHTRNINAPYLNASTLHSLTSAVISGAGRRPTENVMFADDFDGNGLPDLLITSTGGPILSQLPLGKPKLLKLNHSTPTAFTFTDSAAPRSDLDGEHGLYSFFSYFIDINGDGLTDTLGWYQGKLSVRMNLGGAQFTAWQSLATTNMLSSATFGVDVTGTGEDTFIDYPKYFRSLQSVDINNDGVNELLVPGERIVTGCTRAAGTARNCGDAIYHAWPNQVVDAESYDDSIYRYDAIYFEQNADGSYSARKAPTDIIAPATQLAFIDAFGDGTLDVIFNFGPRANNSFESTSADFGTNYGAYIVRNYGSGSGDTSSSYQPTDYLESVTDGFGNSNQWRYRPLSSGEASAEQTKLYSTDHNEVGSGYVHFASSMYVVQSFKQSNAQDSLNDTQYAYKGAMYNLQGRGFTGFNQIWEQDVQRDKTVHSTFKQKFPEVGLLTSQKVSVAGVTVQQTTNTWADNPQHSVTKVYHNMLTKSVQTSKDLTGTALSAQESLVATSDVDQWGNVKKRTQKTTDYIKGQANTYESVTETSFIADVSAWWLTKFDWTQTSTNLALRAWGDDPAGTSDKAQWQRQTVNIWNTTHKQPAKVTYSASGSSCTRIEETSVNAYGLPTVVTATGQSSTCTALTARTTSISYTKDGTTAAVDGYLPYSVTNAKGHISKTEYDMGLGVPIKVTAPNSIVTQTEYDAIGRPVQVKQTGSPTQYLRYLLADNGANLPSDNSNSAVVMTRTSGAGQPETEQYFDAQGRLLRIATQGFNGGYQYQDKHYDALGRLLRESIPYGNGTGAEYTEFSDFDALDRPAKRSIPNGKSGLESTYSYDGLTTDITVGGRTMSRTYGSQGWLYETVDALDGSNRFAYDSAGRPLVIQDANAKKIVASYNGFGHKTKVVDPNQGSTVFGYNSLGELDKQTDANGVVQTYTLDTLGRITSKVTTGGNAPGAASFYWDGDTNADGIIDITRQLGLLSTESENGVSRAYAYTTALQLASTTVTVDGVARTIKHQYDSFYGRPKALEYPNGLTLKYAYNDYGYLEQTSNAASGYLYRSISDMDEAGHITGAKLANNLMTESRAYNGEGTMGSVEVRGPLGLLHAHYYDVYDDFMNLISERNGTTGLTKDYSYDSLNRLSQYRFNGTLPTFNGSVDYAYDKVGNFLKKTDYSVNSSTAYRYGGSASCAAGNNAGPNAVCQLTKLNNTTVNFQYDNRGNLRVGDGLTMTYNAMDKPLTITGRGPGNTTVTGFVYGSDGMRAKQTRSVSGVNTSTYYVDKYYEVDSDGSWRAYLDDIAVLSYTPARQHLLHFTLRDRLGSATTMADQNGVVISRRYFDPFGKTTTQSPSASLLENIRRMTYDLDIAKMQDLDVTNKNRRGFTDHEHLNEQQLIHMNGRVYDYNLGRFMSVDPLIQSPTSTQSVNPYSYIMNNPLAGTDPTGYCSTKDSVAGCSDSLGEGESTDITEGGKVVGTVGKDSQGNMYITKSNGNAGHQAIQGAMGKAGDVSKVGSLEQNSGKGNGGNNRNEGTLPDQIKAQAQDGIASVGKDLGYASEGSVDARWGNDKSDENGKLTNATVNCSTSCQKAAADGHQINVTRLDFQMYHLRQAYYSSQTEVAKNTYKTAEYGSFVFIGSEIIAASVAKWAFLKGSEKLAYFGLIGETASLVTSVDGSAAAVMQGAKTLIPRMRVGPTVGKPKIRVNKDGQYIVD